MKFPLTNTSIFIIPTLNISKKDRIDNGFINGYLKENISTNSFTECVYLLFRPKYPSRFRKFVNQEYESPREIIFDYDIENGFTILVYRLNPKFSFDIELIKNSKYSLTSNKFQSQFPKTVEIFDENFNVIKTENSLQYQIFNKSKNLRDYILKQDPLKFLAPSDPELWYDFEMENETLKTDDLKEIIFEKFQQNA